MKLPEHIPLGLVACHATGANHHPVYNVDTQSIECMDCEQPITRHELPATDGPVDLWLSETTIQEDPV